jgi:hypothetical protein
MRLDDRSDRFPRAHHTESVALSRIEKWIHAYDAYPNYRIDIDPPYQRPHVWTTPQKRAYVEYVLRGGDAARRIMFASRPRNAHEGQRRLLDGKQRISSVIEFCRDELPVFADESSPEGYRASQIKGWTGMSYTLEIQIVTLPTMADEIRLYLMINSGGTPHSSEELERVRAMLTCETNQA